MHKQKRLLSYYWTTEQRACFQVFTTKETIANKARESLLKGIYGKIKKEIHQSYVLLLSKNSPLPTTKQHD